MLQKEVTTSINNTRSIDTCADEAAGCANINPSQGKNKKETINKKKEFDHL